MDNQPAMHNTQNLELVALRAIQQFNEQLGDLFQHPKPLDRMNALAAEISTCEYLLLFILNPENASLELESQVPQEQVDAFLSINTFNLTADSPLRNLLRGDVANIKHADNEARLQEVAAILKQQSMTLVPLHVAGQQDVIGVWLAYRPDEQALSPLQIQRLRAMAPSAAGLLKTIERFSGTQQKLDDLEREMEIFRQIDSELSDTIELEYVFSMIMDWALRFSNADAAGLSLYDTEADTLRLMHQYGFRPNVIEIGTEVQEHQRGIVGRVARSGRAEIVPDVAQDKDYFSVAEGIRTQMTVPIMREEKVIAVLSLESRRFNGFTDKHLEFVKKLTNRAGVAVDNARLFTETRREREKLSYILRNIADIVLVVGLDDRIMLMNYSALLGFQLSVEGAGEEKYKGMLFSDVISHKRLHQAYREAVESDENISLEIDLPNKRTYHAIISHDPQIGRIIVMHDITYFKETDKLKTELVATVSHDLKQPLSVMRGYLDLLTMANAFDERSQRYIQSLEYAFRSMRQLIDDLLDIAHIESGLNLELDTINIADILRRCIRNNQPPAEQKSISISLELPSTLPKISGDTARLEQVFNNLINNAVKYTKPGGYVKLYMEVKHNVLRIYVEDNGLGIGPEDQSQIFERFYRVRRPETESIEGTGLGLAIVKSLVEAHQGKIDLKSELGQGSTFRVTLPLQ